MDSLFGSRVTPRAASSVSAPARPPRPSFIGALPRRPRRPPTRRRLHTRRRGAQPRCEPPARTALLSRIGKVHFTKFYEVLAALRVPVERYPAPDDMQEQAGMKDGEPEEENEEDDGYSKPRRAQGQGGKEKEENEFKLEVLVRTVAYLRERPSRPSRARPRSPLLRPLVPRRTRARTMSPARDRDNRCAACPTE